MNVVYRQLATAYQLPGVAARLDNGGDGVATLAEVAAHTSQAAAARLRDKGYEAVANRNTVMVEVRTGRSRYRITLVNDIQPSGDDHLHDRLAHAFAGAVVRQGMA